MGGPGFVSISIGIMLYMQSHRPEYAVKLSTRNFGFEDGRKTVPLYATFCL